MVSATSNKGKPLGHFDVLVNQKGKKVENLGLTLLCFSEYDPKVALIDPSGRIKKKGCSN